MDHTTPQFWLAGLEIIIVNILLSNAARHAGEGAVYVDVVAIGGEVEVSVADEGPGVGPEMRSRLFTWGAHGPRSPGQGIGLSAARMLAEDLGGRLALGPTVGRGARFVLTLPALVPAEPQGLGL